MMESLHLFAHLVSSSLNFVFNVIHLNQFDSNICLLLLQLLLYLAKVLNKHSLFSPLLSQTFNFFADEGQVYLSGDSLVALASPLYFSKSVSFDHVVISYTLRNTSVFFH